MTFFDKLFTIKNHTSRTENGFKCAIEPLRSSLFEIAKDQIRVVLFRECDKRGRKLLFDSSVIEKLPLASHIKTNNFICKSKYDKVRRGQLVDVAEVTQSYNYRPKISSNDVKLLGEMIFGSVSMVFKGGNTCKIHSLSSPKCIMFTNIIHAPSSCHYKLSSDPFIDLNSACSSETSLDEYSNDKRISSSDSKLYRTHTTPKGSTSTYPSMKQKPCVKNLPDINPCSSDMNSSSSGLNSSLGSLRRRWMQSCSSTVDRLYQEDTDKMKNKTSTKLGLGLVVDLSHNLDNELEIFLFNHTIVIDSIIKKLQSSVESAFARKENFDDLIYNAFIDCQQSMYELINNKKYARPIWLTLIGINDEAKSDVTGRIYSQFQENIKDCKKQDTLNNVRVKFLDVFCEVIVKFDTKDTNFFISTLLTAVLTHHLSWVTSIAETDFTLPPKLQFGIKRPYNPIWAQLNDLNGVLGSPLKSARTMITGCEASRNSMAAIIQALTYFIRCYNVVENVYDFEFEDITQIDDEILKLRHTNESSFRSLKNESYVSHMSISGLKKLRDKQSNSERGNLEQLSEVDVPNKKVFHEVPKLGNMGLQRSCGGDGMKKSKSCIFRSEGKEPYVKSDDLHSGIQKCRISESTNEKINSKINNFLEANECTDEAKNLIRVPNKTILCHLQENLCRNSVYDTLDSCGFPKMNDIENEIGRKDDVLFVLGENEKLINLNKLVMSKSFKVDIIKEELINLSFEGRNFNLPRSKSINIPLPIVEESEDKSRATNNDLRRRRKEMHENYSRNTKRKCIMSSIQELPLPRICDKNLTSRRLDISSVLGSVNEHYNSEQIIQGVLDDKRQWEKNLRRDLALYMQDPMVDKSVTEALCIIGDMTKWEVTLFSNRNVNMDKTNNCGVRMGMSQLVADMLESLLHICRIKLPPDFCLVHIEKKLHEIYTKSKSVAELLNSTELCSLEYLTSRLNISVNDVPLLLSVATTHSPHLSSKYGLTFT